MFGNVGTLMYFKFGAQDAEYMAKEYSPVFSEQDLVNIDKYKAVMKLSIDTQPSKPFSILVIITISFFLITGLIGKLNTCLWIFSVTGKFQLFHSL